MVVTVEPYSPRHSRAQENRHWALLTQIANHMPPYMDGVWHSAEVWHEYFMKRHVGFETHEMPDGSVITRYASSKNLKTTDYADLDEKILADMVEHDFVFEALAA
jgi:hypothetical protein